MEVCGVANPAMWYVVICRGDGEMRRDEEEGKKRERRRLRDEVQRLQLCNTLASLRNWQPGKPTALRHFIVDKGLLRSCTFIGQSESTVSASPPNSPAERIPRSGDDD